MSHPKQSIHLYAVIVGVAFPPTTTPLVPFPRAIGHASLGLDIQAPVTDLARLSRGDEHDFDALTHRAYAYRFLCYERIRVSTIWSA
ncbi:hypothetical protein KR51_00003380 [Rubidibacter lacunae KORDI 51-2]|uniref:Uncharacterized protein n=1 Tax=Rubidibacter lacunae KORDI 51-2 TaxID=582515 RepID=U5DQA0_9CHRO|nr:hypothetical protein KR51_00003380 [Rubidibacter lacunae KORDI 51-2]